MATVRDNPITEGLSGKLGRRLTFRKGRKGKTIVALSPVYSEDRVLSEAQMTHHEAFRQATQYAVGAKDNPIYVNLGKVVDATAYNLAVADWFGQPEVLNIDASSWTGQVGQTLRISAKDDTFVTRVHIVIDNAQGTIFEQGEMVRVDNVWWTYTTTTQIPMDPAPRISATAYDLPGNSNGKVF